MKRVYCILIATLLTLLFLIPAGCGDKPKSTKSPAPKSPSPSKSPALETYNNEEVGYQITIPEGWTKPPDVNVGELFVVFNKATFEPKPNFNIISIKKQKFDLRDSDKQKELKDEIKKGLIVGDERNITVAGQPAYQIIFGVDQDDSSILIHQTYLFNKEYLMVFTGGCKEDKFMLYASDFDKFLSSLKLK